MQAAVPAMLAVVNDYIAGVEERAYAALTAASHVSSPSSLLLTSPILRVRLCCHVRSQRERDRLVDAVERITERVNGQAALHCRPIQ